MRIIYILAFFLLSTSLYSIDSNNTIINIDNVKTPLNLNEYTHLYSTKDTSSDINSVLSKKFRYSPKGLNLGINDSIRWVKLNFKNPSTKTKELFIYYPYSHINKIIAYQQNNGITTLISKEGIYYKHLQKELLLIGHPIKILLNPGETSVYIYVKHLNLPLRGISYLLTKEQLYKLNTQSEYTIWFWKGFFLFTLLITLVLFVSTKMEIFLYYFLLNLGVGLFFSSEIGDFNKYFGFDHYDLTIDIKHLGNLLILVFFPLLINKITPISKIIPRIWKYLFYSIIPLAILWFLCIIPAIQQSILLYITTSYFIYLSAIIFILQLYFAFVGYRHKIKNALPLLIAYGFYVSAVFINVILPNLGVLENDLLVYNSFISGSIFEIVIFMILIGRETLSAYKERSILLEKQKNHQSDIIKAIVDSQEKERNKVGRELHDMIGANISVIKQQIDKSNKPLLNVVQKTIESVRTLSHGLVTPLIKDDDFVDEIIELCVVSSNLDTNIKSNFFNWTKIEDTEKATHLFRIIQELIQNAIKHSKAKNVLIQFIVDNKKELTVMYEDNGIGFDYNEAYNKGLGLINIENRIKLIDASIIFDTKKGRRGTTIIMKIDNI